MAIGVWKLVLILLIVLVIFGAGKLPQMMGDIGKGIRSLKDGLKGAEPDAAPQPKQLDADIAPASSNVSADSDTKQS